MDNVATWIVCTHTIGYCVVAGVVILYYGVRAIIITYRDLEAQNVQLRKERKPTWNCCQKVFVHYIQTFIFNAVCVLSGFVAFFMFCELYLKIKEPLQLDAGTSVLLVSLGLVAITGISGVLPQMLHSGALFGR